MRSDMKLFEVALSLLSLVAPVACEGDPERTCGPNTRRVGNTCVSTYEDVTCAPGTTLDEASGQCVPSLSCGPGTHYDGASGMCLPDSECGPGTTFDPDTGLCRSDSSCGPGTTFNVDTGECEPDLRCGEGTMLVDGQCLPNNQCGTGTTFDPATGTCRPNLACGTGLVEFQNQCLTPEQVVALGRDYAEPVPELNDPAYGGRPEMIALSPIGESTVFTGTISRPIDLDNDGDEDQDRDVWAFAGTAGQRLRIRVLSLGLPQPTFVLTGPNGYVRSSILGAELDAEREVVLPYDGEYQILIAPLVNRVSDAAVGGTTFGYAGILEEVAWPAPRDLVVPTDATPATLMSPVVRAPNRFVQLRAAAGTSILLDARAMSTDTAPVLLAFRADHSFLAEVRFDPARELPQGAVCDDGTYFECHDGSFDCLGEELPYRLGRCDAPSSTTINPVDPLFDALTGLYSIAQDDVVLFVDWVYSNGEDMELTIAASSVEATSLGTATIGEDLETRRTTVPGRTALTFEFVLDEPGIAVTSDFDGALTPELTLIGPNGVIERLTSSTDHHFYAAQAGTYRWVYVNRGATAANVSIAIETARPIDAGADAFDGTATWTGSFTGPDIGYSRRNGRAEWIRITTSTSAIVEANWDYKQGLPDVSLYTVNANGSLANRRLVGEDNFPTVRTRHVGPATTLLRYATSLGDRVPDPRTREWQVDLELYPIPAVGDLEPNDDQASANDLGAIGSAPLRGLGSIVDDEIDVYRFTIDPPLANGEVLRIQAERIESTTATMLRLRDAGFVQLFAESTTYSVTWIIYPHQGTGPFYVEFEGTGEISDYVFELQRVPVLGEAEPNQTPAEAQDLGVISSFPVEVFGVASAVATDSDYYAFTLGQPLAPNQGLWIRIDQMLATNDLAPILYDSDGTTMLAQGLDVEDSILLTTVTSTGPFYLRVAGESATRRELYRVRIDVEDDVYDRPNIGTPANAAVLPTLSAGGSVSTWGMAPRLTSDVYRVELDGALGEGELLSFSWENALERGNIDVEVRDADENVVIAASQYAGELTFGGPGSTGPYYIVMRPNQTNTTSQQQVYRVEVAWLTGGITGEAEPNQDDLTAQPIVLPARIRAQTRGGTSTPDPDVFSFVVENDLAANEAIEIRARVLRSTDDLTVTVRDADGMVLATTTDLDPLVRIPPPVAAGTTLFVEILGTLSTGTERSIYEATVEITP